MTQREDDHALFRDMTAMGSEGDDSVITPEVRIWSCVLWVVDGHGL